MTIDVHWRQALLATLYASTYAPPHPFLSLSLCFSPVIFAFPENGQISAALQRTGSGVCVPSKAHITRLNRPTVYLHHIYTTHVDADSNRKHGSEHRKKNKRYGSNAIKVECVCVGVMILYEIHRSPENPIKEKVKNDFRMQIFIYEKQISFLTRLCVVIAVAVG